MLDGVEEQMQAENLAALAVTPGASPEQSEREEKKAVSAGAPEQRDLFARAQRRKLHDERKSITHKFSVGGHEGYIIVGMYEEGGPGEIFIKMAKEGSHAFGFHGWTRAFKFDRPSVRRATESSGGQAHQHALRAFGIHGESEHPIFQFRVGLHCPLARRQIPLIGISEIEGHIERSGHDSPGH